MIRLFWGKANLSTLTLIQPSLKFLKGNLSFFAQLTFLTGSFASFGKFFLGNIHSTFSGVHPVVCFCVRMMDFVNSARTQCFSYCIMSFRTITLQCGNKYSNINAVMVWISQTESDRLSWCHFV